MALRNITNYKIHDILRKRSKHVSKIDNKILMILDDMAETMYRADGVGLAAPQVGILKRLVVIDIGDGLIKLINPEIVEIEGEQQDIEGCLSDGILFIDKIVQGTEMEISNLNGGS